MGPMISAAFDSLFVVPQIQRLLGRVDAITGSAVKVQIHMHAVPAPQFDGVVNVFQFFFAQFQPVVGTSPAEVRHRQPHEVEAPFLQQRKIAFLKCRVAVALFYIFIQQIESAPARQALRGGGLFFCRTNA